MAGTIKNHDKRLPQASVDVRDAGDDAQAIPAAFGEALPDRRETRRSEAGPRGTGPQRTVNAQVRGFGDGDQGGDQPVAWLAPIPFHSPPGSGGRSRCRRLAGGPDGRTGCGRHAVRLTPASRLRQGGPIGWTVGSPSVDSLCTAFEQVRREPKNREKNARYGRQIQLQS